ncbi:MAG: ABC transporter permease [Rhodospirillaceae bacterium]|nr:ABC transporter permease [Rhodospirillaceae bacterium]
MIRLILQRLGAAGVTLIIICIMVFAAVEVMPGDACTAFLGRDAKGTILEKCQLERGLDRPALERFGEWAGGMIQGDLGMSMNRNKPIEDIVGWRLRNTVILAATATLFGVPIALLLGVIAGLRRDRPVDLILSSIAIFSMTIPEFVSATFLILIFSITLGWTSGVVTASYNAPALDLVASTALPTAALSLILIAHILRMVRSSVIDVMESDFVLMARLKGVPFRQIVWRHVLPNSLLPTINVIGLTIAWLLGGMVVVETVFNYPGLGRLAVDAVSDRDLPLIQTIAIILGSVYILTNLAADLVSLLLNPKLRTYRT